MRFLPTAVVTLLIVQATTLYAQVFRGLNPGTDVRITYYCVQYDAHCKEKGRVVRMTADSIALRIDGQTTGIPLSLVTRLETKTGRGISAGRALGFPVLGLFAGGLVGVVIGYASCAPCNYELEGLVPVAGAGLVGGIGLVTGLVIGLLPRDTWEDTPLKRVRIGVASRREGWLQFGVSLSF